MVARRRTDGVSDLSLYVHSKGKHMRGSDEEQSIVLWGEEEDPKERVRQRGETQKGYEMHASTTSSQKAKSQ